MRRVVKDPGSLPTVCDLTTAKRLAPHFPAVISLAGDLHGYTPLENHLCRLFLPFTDGTIRSAPGSIQPADVDEILGFAAEHTGQLLVHCLYGRSRSTAVAFGIAVFRGLPPIEAFTRLRAAQQADRPFTPNRLVLELFDQALATEGALVAAADRC